MRQKQASRALPGPPRRSPRRPTLTSPGTVPSRFVTRPASPPASRTRLRLAVVTSTPESNSPRRTDRSDHSQTPDRANMHAAPHPRFSVLSASAVQSSEHLSPAASSTRFSLPSAPSINTNATASKPAAPRQTIYDRPLNKARAAEVSASAFAFLFSEVVQYTQKRVSGINDLERRYGCIIGLETSSY